MFPPPSKKDSMEEIKGFLETSFLDWPGKVVSVIFLSSCNFRCPYCHNHPIVLRPEQVAGLSLSEILPRLNKFQGWIDGVVISGGEPTLYKKLPGLIKSIRKNNFLVKLDTNGSNPHILRKLLEDGLLDYVAMDVKAPLDELRYSRAAGKPVNIANIKESLNLLLNGQIDYEFRTTICPALLNEDDCRDLFKQISGAKRLVLQNFNPQSPLDPRLKDVKPLPGDKMRELGKMAKEWVGDCRVIC